MQKKDDQFKRHTAKLKELMDDNVWGKFVINLQAGNIVQSKIEMTFVTDVNGEKLITQQEAEARAKINKNERKIESNKNGEPFTYKKLKVIPRTNLDKEVESE